MLEINVECGSQPLKMRVFCLSESKYFLASPTGDEAATVNYYTSGIRFRIRQ